MRGGGEGEALELELEHALLVPNSCAYSVGLDGLLHGIALQTSAREVSPARMVATLIVMMV